MIGCGGIDLSKHPFRLPGLSLLETFAAHAAIASLRPGAEGALATILIYHPLCQAPHGERTGTSGALAWQLHPVQSHHCRVIRLRNYVIYPRSRSSR